jgi:hypothetical protein
MANEDFGMSAGREVPLRSVGQIASSVAEFLGIATVDPSDPTQFWKDVAVRLTGTYEGQTAADIARWIIEERFDRDWDPEEALDEETGRPAVSAYEEILDIASHLVPEPQEDAGLVDDIIASDEEEEAGSDALAELTERVASQSVDLGLETVLSSIHHRRLVISPEWQRSYVWKASRRKRFIESLLIGLPIPSILTAMDPKTEIEYVIDGRQRLETVVRFCSTREQLAQLQIEERPFKTFATKEPLFAVGAPLSEVANKRFDQFPEKWRNRLYNQTFRIIRFDRLSRSQLYQVFERYNTGGVQLQAQEIRNAVYQNSPLHRHLWNLAREYADPPPQPDAEVERIAAQLRATMDRKADRYGVYSFIGRVMAFTFFQGGRNRAARGFQANYTATVASATNDFMDDFENLEWDELRSKWIRMYDKTVEWYTPDYALVRPTAANVPFHAFLGTVQLATTAHLLDDIDGGRATEDAIVDAIHASWEDFALNKPIDGGAGTIGIASQKQNSTLFWSAQRRWLSSVRDLAGIPGPVVAIEQ